MNDLFAFTLGPESGSGQRLRDYLAASVKFEFAQAARTRLASAVITISLVVWVSAVWPRLLPAFLCRLAWAAWMITFGGLLVAGAVEWAFYRRKMTCLSRLGAPPASAACDGAKTPPLEP
jgi:hypothetical protein